MIFKNDCAACRAISPIMSRQSGWFEVASLKSQGAIVDFTGTAALVDTGVILIDGGDAVLSAVNLIDGVSDKERRTLICVQSKTHRRISLVNADIAIDWRDGLIGSWVNII